MLLHTKDSSCSDLTQMLLGSSVIQWSDIALGSSVIQWSDVALGSSVIQWSDVALGSSVIQWSDVALGSSVIHWSDVALGSSVIQWSDVAFFMIQCNPMVRRCCRIQCNKHLTVLWSVRDRSTLESDLGFSRKTNSDVDITIGKLYFECLSKQTNQ